MSQCNPQDFKQINVYLFIYYFYVFMHAFGVKLDLLLMKFLKIKWYLKTRGMTTNV